MKLINYEHKDEPIYGTHYSRWWLGDQSKGGHLSFEHTVTDHTMGFMSVHRPRHAYRLHWRSWALSLVGGQRMPFKEDEREWLAGDKAENTITREP